MPKTDKHTVVVASVLKPVDDTRGYEKIGRSLAGSGLFDVHLIGCEGSATTVEPSIKFHSLGKLQRLSLKRWLASFRVLAMVRVLRPDVLVICTHELAVVGVYAKVFLRSKIIYDVQENYFRNIIHTNAFPFPLRWPLAFYVRAKEIICSLFFDKFFVAERIYKKQLGFTRGKSVPMENKAVVPTSFQRRPVPGIELLFSGTLSASTGVFEAIRIATLLHQEDNSIRLHIIGYCVSAVEREKINYEANGKAFIQLTGIDNLQPHELIMKAISTASFGLVCYPHSPHTERAVPTKVYEYLSCGLPALVTTEWATLFESYQAAVVFDPDTPAKEVINQLRNGKFYLSRPERTLWKDQEATLIESVSHLVQ